MSSTWMEQRFWKGVALPGVYDKGRKVVGTADFDKGGNKDILWQHAAAGIIMSGTTSE